MKIEHPFLNSTLERNQVMEDIVRAVSLTTIFQIGQSSAKNRFWRSMDGRNCVGRFVPSNVERTDGEQSAAETERQVLWRHEIRTHAHAHTRLHIHTGFV